MLWQSPWRRWMSLTLKEITRIIHGLWKFHSTDYVFFIVFVFSLGLFFGFTQLGIYSVAGGLLAISYLKIRPVNIMEAFLWRDELELNVLKSLQRSRYDSVPMFNYCTYATIWITTNIFFFSHHPSLRNLVDQVTSREASSRKKSSRMVQWSQLRRINTPAHYCWLIISHRSIYSLDRTKRSQLRYTRHRQCSTSRVHSSVKCSAHSSGNCSRFSYSELMWILTDSLGYNRSHSTNKFSFYQSVNRTSIMPNAKLNFCKRKR